MLEALPYSEKVDVDRLARLFRSTTQSYKFLFFQAIIASIQRSPSPIISFDDLLADMILGAWWPIVVSRLNIGNAAGNDILTSLVGRIDTSSRTSLSRQEALTAARANLEMGNRNTPLRYVVGALVEPWTGASSASIYERQANTIVLNQSWLAYFTSNLPVVQGWVDHAWCMWVQNRNPNVPVNMEKLVPIDFRRSLSDQRAFIL